MSLCRSIGLLALVAAATPCATSAHADWVSQGYSYVRTVWKRTPQPGTGVTWSAGASGATVTADTDADSTCGAEIAFMTSWYWNGQGQYYQPYTQLTANKLEGSAESGAWAEAGFSIDPVMRIGKDTDADGNPFSIMVVDQRRYCFHQGSGFGFTAWADTDGRNSGSAQATSHVYCTAP
ncbi:MAG: hypothetical protein IT208_11715 [Chthonomonadales bacterium]|nr:hypothetical protein [Chthonomonadales bacterium]